MPVALLNHDFVDGMAHRMDLRPVALGLHDAQRRLSPEPVRVHPIISGQDTGAGTFVQWANRSRADADDDRRSLAELLLRLLGGPFVTDLAVAAGLDALQSEPPLPDEPAWRREAVEHLAAHALSVDDVRPWILSFDPQSDLRERKYGFTYGQRSVVIENFLSHTEVANRLVELATQGLVGALATLEAAGRHASRLIILDKARDSARRWTLDCAEATLFRALVGLEVYAAALDEGLSRELAAVRYQEACGVELSRESGEVGRSPTCKRQRMIDVAGRGVQYFDMHAKPGRTRVHIWTDLIDDQHVVYVGHCGEHLPLPGGKR